MKIYFLGTSAGLPTKDRNTQTTVLDMNPVINTFWMFDVGEGAQHRIMNTPIRLGKVSTIFITHLHGDHLFGLPGVLTSRSFQGGEGRPLTLVGPVGIKSYVETIFTLTASHLNYQLEIIEVEDQMALQVEGIDIEIYELNHGIPSFGYRLTMPDTEGGLIVEKLKEAGIEPGPIYRLIKEQETIEINGIQILTNQFKKPHKPGLKLAFFGDTMPTERENKVCQHVDIMVHESTYLEGDKDLSHRYHHSHIDDVAELAANNQVGYTIINHISNRYTDEDLIQLEQQIKLQYPEFKFVIARDYDIFEF